jgi:hypothetical protein
MKESTKLGLVHFLGQPEIKLEEDYYLAYEKRINYQLYLPF